MNGSDKDSWHALSGTRFLARASGSDGRAQGECRRETWKLVQVV